MRSLNRHTKAVHQGKKFTCQECGTSFTRMDALIRHGQHHWKLVTHKRDKCLKEFYRCDKLTEHRISCDGNILKRKSDETDNSIPTKKSKVDDQVGTGDDDPCNLVSASEENLKN